MNETVNAAIRFLGTAVPAHRISQHLHHSILESANGLNRAERLMLKSVYHNSGVRYRHSVLAEFGEEDSATNEIFNPAGLNESVSIARRMEIFDRFAAPLCCEAIKNAVGDNVDVLKQVTHLITFSCTGMSAPGVDIQIVEHFGLDRSIERTCINFMGCYAGINALKTASYISRSDANAVVLVVGVEICTIHYKKSSTKDQLIANALFSDGAAAAIVTQRSAGIIDKPGLRLAEFYSEFHPSGRNEMAWSIGDQAFDIKLSTYVPHLVRENIGLMMSKLFKRSGITQGEIDWYALHPGGVKILEACEQALGLSKEQNRFSYDVLDQYGNMSSVTVLFVLKKYFDSLREPDKGKKILSCAFGPGLTMETMILHVD